MRCDELTVFANTSYILKIFINVRKILNYLAKHVSLPEKNNYIFNAPIKTNNSYRKFD